VMFIHVNRQSLLTMNKMKQLAASANASIGIGILSSIILMFPLGLKGIVLGGTIGIFCQFLFLDMLLSRYSGRIWGAEDGIFLLKIFLLSGIALILSYALGSFVPLLSADRAGISVLLNFLVYILIYVMVAVKTGTIGLIPILSSLDRLSQSITK
jgi:peptidoglycan biosynthesis protein MviN/MurJ (putative lipid II flippase)